MHIHSVAGANQCWALQPDMVTYTCKAITGRQRQKDHSEPKASLVHM